MSTPRPSAAAENLEKHGLNPGTTR